MRTASCQAGSLCSTTTDYITTFSNLQGVSDDYVSADAEYEQEADNDKIRHGVLGGWSPAGTPAAPTLQANVTWWKGQQDSAMHATTHRFNG